jgi:hypothetical protein
MDLWLKNLLTLCKTENLCISSKFDFFILLTSYGFMDWFNVFFLQTTGLFYGSFYFILLTLYAFMDCFMDCFMH